MRLHSGIALVALLGGAPLAAQSTNTVNAASSAATPPAPVPPPPDNAVGPPQLRDFTLNGTVTQPARTPVPAPGTAPPATGAPTAPATAEPPAIPAPREPAGRARAIAPRAPDAAPAGAVPDAFAPIAVPVTGPAVRPPAVDEAAPSTPVETSRPLLWPWLAVLLAVVLGAAFWWWRRQPERYAAERPATGPLVARDMVPPPLPRAPPAPATPAPAPAPVAPASAGVLPAQPVVPAPAPVPPAIAGGIVASGLQPRIEFELVPLRAETDAAAGAAVTVEIIVINRGSAPARDVLVEAQLINAGPGVDQDVGRFFLKPPGTGERVPLIKPMSRITVQVRLAAEAAELAPLVVEGRKLLVPLIAVNAAYRWSGGERTDSASFLVGRGDAEAAKLAPFRLDLGARRWSGLAARLHSNGLERR